MYPYYLTNISALLTFVLFLIYILSSHCISTYFHVYIKAFENLEIILSPFTQILVRFIAFKSEALCCFYLIFS